LNREYCPEGTRKDAKEETGTENTEGMHRIPFVSSEPVVSFFALFRVPSGQYSRFREFVSAE
jgi:hypothetical protein